MQSLKELSPKDALIQNYLLNNSIFADTAALDPNGIRTFLANGMSTFFINSKQAEINGLRIQLLFYQDIITFVISFVHYLLDLFLDLFLT